MARTTRKTTARKPAAKRKAVRTTKAKRSASAKKAARTRAANKRKRSASAKKAVATRKRNSRRKPAAAKRTASKRKPRTNSKAKRSAAAKKGWASRRRASRKPTTKRRAARKPTTKRRASRTTTRKPRTSTKGKRSRAAKKGWATRRRNSGRRGARKASKRTSSKRRTSRRRSSRKGSMMKMPSMKGLKGGLRTLVMGATAIGLVGLLVYTPLNLVAAQTGQITNAAAGMLNNLPISSSNAADLLNIGAGVATLAIGGMIFQAAKKRKMFTAKTQGMLMPFLIAGVSLNTASKIQTLNIGSAFGQLATGKPAAALNNFSSGRFSIRANNVLPNNSNNGAQSGQQGQQGARLGGASLGSSIYGTHTGGSNALYQNNSANSGRIFGSRLGSAKRKVNLF